MTQLELFAGIGGFGLAGHWAGIKTVCQVEIDPFCQKVLQKNFPDAHRHADIHTFYGTPWRGSVDIISGGFPCQPYSSAGKRLGKEDERHLWPEMLRVIREVRPRWVVGENVLGLINWSGGLVFDEVQSDLEAAGYEVQAYVLPASAVGAPHQRYRVWFAAYANKIGCEESNGERRNISKRKELSPFVSRLMRSKTIANSNQTGREKRNPPPVSNWTGFDTGNIGGIWDGWTSEPPICGMDDGLSAGLDKYRNKRLGALGNAIVPQVAYQIFKSIVEYDELC